MAKKKRRGKRKNKSQHQRNEFKDLVESYDEQDSVGDEKKGEGEKEKGSES